MEASLSYYYNNKTQQRLSIFHRLVTLNHYCIKVLYPRYCPSVPCSLVTILHSPLQHSHQREKNAVWVSLDPSAPAMTSSASWSALALSNISTAKKECFPLLLCFNLISSLSLSNSPISLLITLLLSFFFSPLYSKTWEGNKNTSP